MQIDAPVNFELAAEPHPMIAMPNPAQREIEQPVLIPPPESPAQTPAAIDRKRPAKAPEIAGFELVQKLIQETVVEKIAETVKETIEQTIIAALPEKADWPASAAQRRAPHCAAR